MALSLLQDSLPSLHGVPFAQKWGLLKSTIERLYIDENRELADVIEVIRKETGFDASESQYKYRIKEWKLKKSTSTSKKAALYQVIQRRAQLGKSSTITSRGQDFDTTNFRRYLKAEKRKADSLQPGASEAVTDVNNYSGRITLSGNRIFMNWNMPYGTMRASTTTTMDHVSPFSDIMVTTPASPHATPSPMAVAVKELTTAERTSLFVQGRQMDLLRSLEKPQMVTLSTWMYQYWLFAFKTAKHWGRGPQDWTASILGFDKFRQQTTVSITSPNTPAAAIGTPVPVVNPRTDDIVGPTQAHTVQIPSSLCRWSIHRFGAVYPSRSCRWRSHCDGTERSPSPPRSPAVNIDLDDEQSWSRWPDFHDSSEYWKKLSDNLESNDFSNVKSGDLPLDHKAIAARRSSLELLLEAFGFSIMSRNISLIMDFCDLFIDSIFEATGLFPFHLAVSYLDGSKTCCNILNELLIADERSVRKLYVNELGHTVLDQLMIAILKSHTSCSPIVVGPILMKEKRFEGEDVDICGRWDSDSECIRTLLSNGTSSIPFEWKHMFCHTSVQTICHCIGNFFGFYWSPDINTPSGLFLRSCLHCGLKLQLLPLHTLLIVGFHLSNSGCKDETLFGILACLLCLLSKGANSLLKASISVQALLDTEEGNECRHEELDPVELAEKILIGFKSTWSRELSTAWQVICHVLRHSQAEWKGEPSKHQAASNGDEHNDYFDMFVRYDQDETSADEELDDREHPPYKCSAEEYHQNFFGKSEILAPLWAAVQTEFLTYRRLEEGDEWISQNFNMHTLNEGLTAGGKVDVALVQENMMKAFCSCGELAERQEVDPACPGMESVMAYDFSNLHDFDRTTIIEAPGLHRLWAYLYRYGSDGIRKFLVKIKDAPSA